MNTPDLKKPPQSDTRTPIPLSKLIITHANPHGVKVPKGYEGKSEEMRHSLLAGIEGDVKTEIDLLPWMHAYRITRTRRIMREEKGKNVEGWTPMGAPFFMPREWAIWIPVEE